MVQSDYIINNETRQLENEILLNEYVNLIDYRVSSSGESKHEVKLLFKVIETIPKDWRIFLHGRVENEDLNRLPKVRRKHGFDNWDFHPKVKTSGWQKGSYTLVSRRFQANPARYLFETYF